MNTESYINESTKEIPEQLAHFVRACQTRERDLALFRDVDGHLCVRLHNATRCIDGFNFPYQAYLITHLMDNCGSFR